MTEPWLHYFSVLALKGLSEEQLAREAEKRSIEALRLVLENGKCRKNWPCQGGIHDEDARPEESYALYGYSVVYRGKDYDRAYGIQRSLVGLCRPCLELVLSNSQKEEPT